MKQNKKHIILILNLWISFLGFSLLLSAQNTSAVRLLTTQTVFEAEQQIILEFETTKTVSLYCHSSYGSSIIYPNYELGNGYFQLPSFLTSKKGILDFQLISEGKSLYKGRISITANPKSKTKLESYIGPPSISAGTNDYTMLVVIPTDKYDNPVADETSVKIKHQFLENLKEETENTADFIAWKNIHSYKSSGRLLVSSTVNETNSKEFSIEVFPAQPTNFTIEYSRKHPYADGNQVTTFTSSIIKDRYNNIISDGTIVDFIIKDTKGAILKTQGNTIKGIANAHMLHPDQKETWQVTAYISGMAVSNSITMEYKAVTDKLPIAFAEKNRKITVGPLHSFMGQVIPDGAVVKLSIFKNDSLLETKLKTTDKGLVVFELKKGFYSPNTYSFTIEALGLKTEHKNIKL